MSLRGEYLKKYPKTIVIVFFIFNLVFTWIYLKTADFLVSLASLSELSGYRLTEDEKISYFRIFCASMFLIQALLQTFIIILMRKRHVQLAIFTLHIVANAFLFLWFVYEVYGFTIDGF